MKWEARIAGAPALYFVIEFDRFAGYYIYRFENGNNTHDYLQDTLEIAKEFSWEEFNVPLDAWRQVEE